MTLLADGADRISPHGTSNAGAGGNTRSADASSAFRWLSTALVAAVTVGLAIMLATSLTELEGRIARIDAKLDAVSRQVFELSASVQAIASTARSPESHLTEAASPALPLSQLPLAELEGLHAKLDLLSRQVSELSASVDITASTARLPEPKVADVPPERPAPPPPQSELPTFVIRPPP